LTLTLASVYTRKAMVRLCPVSRFPVPAGCAERSRKPFAVEWFAFYLAAMVGSGFRVHSFLSAIVGSLVVGLVSSFVGTFGLLGSESRSALRQELFFYRIQ
jgi:hypothetical protein